MANSSRLDSVPYPIPQAVATLGEPEQIFLPAVQPSGPGKLTGALLAVLCAGFLGIGGMLLYCAVHPFGTSPPPPLVCWIAGGVLLMLSGLSAYGSYRFLSGAGDNKQAYLIYRDSLVELRPQQHRIIPWQKITPSPASRPALKTYRFATDVGKGIAFDSTLPGYGELASVIESRSGASAKSTHKAASADEKVSADAPDVSMESSILSQPVRLQYMQVLMEALCQAAPERYTMIHLLADLRKAGGKTAVLFTFGSPDQLREYTTHVPDSVANATFSVVDSLLREDETFPGFEIILRQTSASKWKADFRRLDEHRTQWEDLPRYPLRVCGYGLSLAPVPGTVFRWMHNKNPFGIIASVQTAQAGATPQRVQVILDGASQQVVLGEGVAKAEEVVQIAEGASLENWTIETPIFHATWPNGFDFRFPLASKTRFDLLGSDNSLIFVQGPVPNAEVLESMPTPEQRLVERGKTSAGHEWIEVSYQVQGSRWRQRHYSRNISPKMCFVVTAQSPLSGADKTFQASTALTDSLQKPPN
jgi:hypothetical protein